MSSSAAASSTHAPSERLDASSLGEAMDLDFSLALLNRTGAYQIGRDLRDGLAGRFSDVSYWRAPGASEPQGLARKLLARAMLAEVSWRTARGRPARPEPHGRSCVLLDPLYALTRGVGPRDVVLCHDVGPISHPELYPTATHDAYALAYRCVRDAAPAMAFVSAASRSAFTHLYGGRFPSLDVIPLYLRGGLDGEAVPIPELTRPFLLSVGAIGRRKNTAGLIAGYRASRLAEAGVELVVCGARDSGFEAARAAADSTPGVRLLPYVSDAQLRWLYGRTLAFCLASLLEGFGMPALEAAARGAPCVVSGDALAEAVGGHAIRVDALSTASIAEGLLAATRMTPESRARRVEEAGAFARRRTRALFLERWDALLARRPGRLALQRA